MKKITRVATTTVLLSCLAGCGVSVRATPFAPGRHAPLPPGAPVQMFSTRIPDCPYEELGLLRAEPKSGFTPWQRVVDAFLARARQMGGDGVILQRGVELRAADDGSVGSAAVLSGTVVRFASTECHRE
jgi:hypothetical protein